MKRRGIRVLSALLAVAMTICFLPAGAVQAKETIPADEAIETQITGETMNALSVSQQSGLLEDTPTSGAFGTSGEFTWNLDTTNSSNYILTISGDGDLPDFAFGDSRPWEPWRVDTVRLTGNITAIGDYLFADYASIKHINLPATLTRIGQRALESVSITGLAIPYGATEIGAYAFYGTDIEWVDIPDTVTSIGAVAFGNTDLSAVVIPDSVESLGTSMFQNCSRLQSVVLPAHMTAIPDFFFKNSGLQYYDIPPQIETIGEGAFSGTNLNEIYIPSTVTSIGEEAFSGTALEQVVISGTLESLPQACFSGCSHLTYVDIESEITEIGYHCFAFAPVEILILPSTLTFIDKNGFYALRGVFARGPGVNEGDDNNNLFSHPYSSVPGTPTIFYIPGQEGWCGLNGENCSDTMWYGYPLQTWDGKNAVLPDAFMDDYYATPENKFFCIQVPGASYPPPTGFQIQIGEEIYNTGSSDRITIPVPNTYNGNIIFSKEGFLTYEMPAELAGSFNWVTMWPDDGGTTPVLQAIYIDNSSGSYKGFGNLRTKNQTIYEMDSTSRRFYVSVLWRDGEEGTISLVQNGKEMVQLENHAWTTFQPGMIFTAAGRKIYLQAENSTNSVTTALKLNMRTPQKNLDVDFGPSVSGTTGSGCEAMQNEKLELEINGGALPVTMKIEDNKVIGVIGISVEASKAEAAFNKAKELIDKADDGIGENIFEQFRNLYGGVTGKKDLWPERQGSMVVESNIQFLGYFEGRFQADEYGKISLDLGMSKLAMKLEGEAAHTQQTFIFGIPIYWQLKLAAMLETAFQLYQETGLEEATLPELNMKTELSLEGALAAGIADVVAGGIKAKGAFETETKLPIDPDDMTLKMTGHISAFVTLVGLSGEKELLDGTYIFYEDGVWCPDEQLRTRLLQAADENIDFSKVSRTYLENGTAFVANEEPKTRAMIPETGTVTTKQIMANNYPYAAPQLITLPDGSQILVWLEDDGTENQGTKLLFSYFDGKNWSDPAPIEEDGTSDFAPELKLVGDTLYLLWLDTERAIPADCTDVSIISSLLDVSMAVFDAEKLTFESTVTFGQSGVMDILPDVTVYQEHPVVVWSSSHDHLLSVSESGLWMGWLGEDGWQQSQLYTGLADVDSLCADTMHGAFTISFSQSEGEASDPERKELYTLRYLYENGQFVRLGQLVKRTENDISDTNPSNHGGLLYWCQGDRLINNAGQMVDLAGSGGRYQMLDDGEGTYAVIYAVVQSDDTFDYYVVMNDGSGWGEPVCAASSTGWITGWSAQFNAKGNLTIAASELDGDMASLSVYTIVPKKDLAIRSVYYDGYSLVPGQELTIFADVENIGLTEVSSYTITGKIDGTSAGSYKGGTLRPGEKETVLFTCTVPNDSVSELLVSLGSDTNPDNNTAALTLAKQDLSVEGIHLSLDDNGGGEAAVSVINRGIADSGKATLVLKRAVSDRSAKGAVVWETLSAPVTIETLSPQVMTAYTLALTTPVEQGDMVYAVLEIQDADHLLENNSEFTVAVLPEAGSLVFDDSRILSMSDDKAMVQVAAENCTALAADGLIYVASYDQGKMINIKAITLSAAPGECLLEQVEMHCPTAGEVRMFVLDPETFSPVHEMHILEYKQ